MSEKQHDERGPVSWEAFNWMRQEIALLQADAEQLRRDVDYWQQQTNHYMKANYSPAQIAEFSRRRALVVEELEQKTTPTQNARISS